MAKHEAYVRKKKEVEDKIIATPEQIDEALARDAALREQRIAAEREQRAAQKREQEAAAVSANGSNGKSNGHQELTAEELAELDAIYQATLPRTKKADGFHLRKQDRRYINDILPQEQYARAVAHLLEGQATPEDTGYIANYSHMFDASDSGLPVVDIVTPVQDTVDSRTRYPWDKDVDTLLARLDSYPPVLVAGDLTAGRWTSVEIAERSVTTNRWQTE